MWRHHKFPDSQQPEIVPEHRLVAADWIAATMQVLKMPKIRKVEIFFAKRVYQHNKSKHLFFFSGLFFIILFIVFGVLAMATGSRDQLKPHGVDRTRLDALSPYGKQWALLQLNSALCCLRVYCFLLAPSQPCGTYCNTFTDLSACMRV